MLYNNDFGTLENSIIAYAPKNLELNGTWYCPCIDDNLYIEAGYMRIVNTPYPDDGKYYVSSWEVQDGQIVQVWTETTPPPEPEPPEDPVLDLEDMTVDHEYRITLLELGVQ